MMEKFNREQWEARVRLQHPKTDGVTDWISGTVEPVHQGWYERVFSDGILRHWWDGRNWYAVKLTRRNNSHAIPHWRQVGDYPMWRGVAGEQPWVIATPSTLFPDVIVYLVSARHFNSDIKIARYFKTRESAENATKFCYKPRGVRVEQLQP